MDRQKRLVAFKVNIKDILSANFVKEEGWNPNYLELGDKKISRVNLMGTITNIETNEQNMRILLDDGSASINLIAFDKVHGIDMINVGDIVLVIGKPRTYNEEKYIVPEIIKKVHKDWLLVRKHEIVSEPEELAIDEVIEDEEIIEEELSPIDIIIQKIRDLDKGEGVTHDMIASKVKIQEIDKIIISLLERGEIFEIMPGKFKVLE